MLQQHLNIVWLRSARWVWKSISQIIVLLSWGPSWGPQGFWKVPPLMNSWRLQFAPFKSIIFIRGSWSCCFSGISMENQSKILEGWKIKAKSLRDALQCYIISPNLWPMWFAAPSNFLIQGPVPVFIQWSCVVGSLLNWGRHSRDHSVPAALCVIHGPRGLQWLHV